MSEQEAITLQAEVKVFEENGDVTVQIPPEIRLTERLVAHLHQAIDARGFALKHWTVSKEQEGDLKNLNNVAVLEEKEQI